MVAESCGWGCAERSEAQQPATLGADSKTGAEACSFAMLQKKLIVRGNHYYNFSFQRMRFEMRNNLGEGAAAVLFELLADFATNAYVSLGGEVVADFAEGF